jgi:hypothetical protein
MMTRPSKPRRVKCRVCQCALDHSERAHPSCSWSCECGHSHQHGGSTPTRSQKPRRKAREAWLTDWIVDRFGTAKKDPNRIHQRHYREVLPRPKSRKGSLS